MGNTAIVTAPSSDQTTRHISAWAKKTIKELTSKRLKFILLEKERAVLSTLQSMIKKCSPSFLFLNGHGASDLVCGHDNEILIQAGKNETMLGGAVTYALSCSSAKELGPTAVQAGAIAYIGYSEDFVFFISSDKVTRPLHDKTAELFLAPANQVIVSLSKGHTTGEATEAAKNSFVRNIQKLTTSEASREDREYARFLFWNMRNLICHGDSNAHVSN